MPGLRWGSDVRGLRGDIGEKSLGRSFTSAKQRLFRNRFCFPLPVDIFIFYVIIIDNDNVINNDHNNDSMTHQKLDLVFHPVRLRLLQVLSNSHLTTQEIADLLPSIPKSSIYRHLKLLLDEGLVRVTDTRPVKGIL